MCYVCHRGSVLKEMKAFGSTFFIISKLDWFWLCHVWQDIVTYDYIVCVLSLVDINNLKFEISK